MYGSIVVPDAGKDRNERGEVIAVGPGKPTATGHFIETTVKEGEMIDYMKYIKTFSLQLEDL